MVQNMKALITPEIAIDLIKDYNNGLSFKQLSLKYGFSSATINKYFKGKKIPVRKSGGTVTFDVEKAIKLYKDEGLTIHEIAAMIGVNKTAIFEQFKKFNIDTTDKRHNDHKAIAMLINQGVPDDQIASLHECSIYIVERIRRSLGIYICNVVSVRKMRTFMLCNKHMPFDEMREYFKQDFAYQTIVNNYKKIVNKNCPTIGTNKARFMLEYLDIKRLVIEQMIQDECNLVQISKTMNIPSSIMRKWVQINNIAIKDGYKIKTLYYKMLTDFVFMQNLANDPFVTVKDVAEIYFNNEICVGTIDTYAKRLGLTLAEKKVTEKFPQLLDKAFMEQEYAKKSLQDIATDIGCSHPTIRDVLFFHNIPIKREHLISKFEKQVLEYVYSIVGYEIIENDRKIIGPKELDIVIPELKIAIECCGIYWHSEKFKPSHYHKEKMLLAKEKGYRLITIFEDEWMFKRKIVEQKLANILQVSEEKIFARKCVIQEVKADETRNFVDENHIQGYTKTSINIGLYFEDELVGIMCFTDKKEHYYLSRFCTSVNVVGGFSKLLKYAIKKFNMNKIVTFADLRWSSDEHNVYLRNGFIFDRYVEPTYMYFDFVSKQLKHRSLFTRAKLQQKLGDRFNPALTERQNANSNGYYATYNCGLVKYLFFNQRY